MVKVGILFPGQGAQFVGMGKEWAKQFQKVRQLYEEADQILGVPITQFCFDGPEEMLTRTLYAQPAIFVTSLALFSVLEEKLSGFKPDFTAGLSLGEFSALVAAASLSFSEGLKLVQLRGELMERAASHTDGTMISIQGLSQEECRAVAIESETELANLNAPDQFVLSGKSTAIELAATLADGMGAKRVIRLKVGGAFHSSLMEEARQGLQAALKKVTLQVPRCLFVANTTARGEKDPERIRLLLAEQLTSPVYWVGCMEYAKNQGIQRFIEMGPGRVLKGLAKRIDPSLEVLSFEKPTDLEKIEPVFEKA
jgi:[acyl-carrier-protein] S-malonyltransferase